MRELLGAWAVCVAAVGCSSAAPSNTADQTHSVSEQAGPAGRAAASGAGASAGLAQGPAAGVGGTKTVGVAGMAAAQPSAGVAGAPRAAASAGQLATAAAAGASSAQAGAGTAGSAGAAGNAAAAAGAGAAGNPCPFPLQGIHEVDNGVAVTGAGCKQMWEGIVETVGGRGLCSAAFISAQHLISASHCYANDGPVSLQVSAPTWDKGMSHTFQAQVKRSGSDMELDISVIDLGKPVDWATAERRFVLHAGKAAPVDLHLYGFGDSSTGAAGTLRTVPKNATIHVTDSGKGTLTGVAGDARLCEGDSGGPALVEKTAAVLYGVNQAIDPPNGGFGVGPCAKPDWTIVFTNVTQYMSFVEKALGKPCERKQVDGMDVAQCW